MTERVVDRLEVIQVEKQDREPTGLAFKRGKSLRQPVHEGGPVHADLSPGRAGPGRPERSPP